MVTQRPLTNEPRALDASFVGVNCAAPIPPILMRISCAAVLAATAVCAPIMIWKGAGLRFVSGSWTALAVDVSHGILYRPVVGPIGYGGTRYMPLHFSLHGGLIALTNNAIVSGAIVTLLSAIALLTGVYALLRAYGVTRQWAACGVVLTLASIASQLAIVTIRGDLLPAALNVWGLALFARRRNDQTVSVLFPALLFSLAFAAKITSLFGLAACIVYLALQQNYRDGLRMIVAAAFGMIVVLVVAYFASGGRIIESMRVCGSGGAGVFDIVKAPLKFVIFACLDLGFLPFFLAAVIVLAARFRESLRELYVLAVLWTLAATVFIFGSPGIDFNHLLDLHVACVVVLTIHGSRKTLPPVASPIFAAGGLLACIAISAVCTIAVRAFPNALHDDRLAAYNAAHDGSGPVLSEDPWVPVMGGETPFLLDPFNLRLACAQDERVRKDLWNRIASHYFSGVVLTPIEDRTSGEFDLDGTWFGTIHYGGLHFPPGFIEHMYAHYEPASHIGCYLVLKPKKMSTGPGL